jgi:hypothetical protein
MLVSSTLSLCTSITNAGRLTVLRHALIYLDISAAVLHAKIKSKVTGLNSLFLMSQILKCVIFSHCDQNNYLMLHPECFTVLSEVVIR